MDREQRMFHEQRMERKSKEIERYNMDGVNDLLEKGNIEEAAAVFSHQGLALLMSSFEESIEKAVNKKIAETLAGLSKGIERYAQERTSEPAKALAKTFVGEFVVEKEDPPASRPKIEILKQGVKEKIEEEKEELKVVDHPNLVTEDIGFPVPYRNGNVEQGIAWSQMSEEQQKRVMFYFMDRAYKSIGKLVAVGKTFKGLGTPYNGCYQQALKMYPGGGAWGKVVNEYWDFKKTRIN